MEFGTKVTEGQQIGDVGDLVGLDLSMVHFEMYSGAASGPLTVPSNTPFMRRSDLIDPTAHLDQWAAQVTGSSAAAGPAKPAVTRPVLRLGSSGRAVLAWQRSLLGQGLAISLDSEFGPTTEAATKQFQTHSDLPADGVVGPATYAEMIEAEKV